MSDKTEAELRGVDRERLTARTDTRASVPLLAGEAPAINLMEALRRSSSGHFIPANDDTARLDWLQRRGRVKARKYGDMKDNFTWDCTETKTLRDAIDERMRGDV